MEDDYQRALAEVAGLTISGVGIRAATTHNRLRTPRVLPEFALVYLLSGCGEFESSESPRVEVKKGACFFLFPGVRHLYGPLEDGYWKEIWVIFSGPLARQLQQKKQLDSKRPVHSYSRMRQIEIEQVLFRLADRHRYLGARRKVHMIDMISDLYQALLLLLAPGGFRLTALGEGPEADGMQIAEMQELLRRHMHSDKNVAHYFYTDQEPYNTLRLKFKTLTGLTPARCLNRMRIERAKELLLWTDLAIQDIALSVGLQDQFHFSRLFKQHTGVSPSAFRARFLQDTVLNPCRRAAAPF